MALIFLLSLPFCPWMWKPLTDSYFPYSGTVVEKGIEHHYFAESRDDYIIIQDANSSRTKKYLTEYESAFVDLGSFVVKEKGFGHLPLRPGQLDPRDTRRLLKEAQTRTRQ